MKKPSDPELWIFIAALLVLCLFVGLGAWWVYRTSGG